jgi:aldehyde dehydrogenase (NAD+)
MSIKEIFIRMKYGKAPEDREVAELWYGGHHNTLLHYINGEWQEPASGEFFETSNLACNEVLVRVADGNAEDTDRAVAAATAAAPAWAALGGQGRARYLYAIARQVQKHSRLLAVLESLDNGKPIRESRNIDISLVARHFNYHADWAQVMEREMPGFQPLGVVGQVIGWNFPLLMAAWKVAPALAMGNTVVLKPAKLTPSTAALLAQICDEAGLPDGVFNLLLGDGKAGVALF